MCEQTVEGDCPACGTTVRYTGYVPRIFLCLDCGGERPHADGVYADDDGRLHYEDPDDKDLVTDGGRDGYDRETTRDDELVVYRCTDCGKMSVSIGWLHAHIEAKHYGFGPFNIIPNPRRIGNFQADMKKTDVLRVTDYKTADLDEVNVRA